MGVTAEQMGPASPTTSTPPRRPGSVRRTTSIDTVRPDGIYGRSVVDARAREGVTAEDGTWSTVETASFSAAVDGMRGALIAIEPVPDPTADIAALVGASVGGGFRRRIAQVMEAPTGPEALLFQLLDDLVGAALVSGYAIQRAEAVAGSGPVSDMTRENPEILLGQAGICAGWATDGVMLTQFRAAQRLPNIVGPDAPPLDGADPWAWHAMEPLPAHGMRRVRRIDVGPGEADGTAPFDVHFRDTHMNPDPDLGERVVHEYSGHGRLDTVAGAVTGVAVSADVLPWVECPGAVASAQRIVAVPTHTLRDMVRVDLTGVSTCTHLNDVLRSLADLGSMLAGSRSGRTVGFARAGSGRSGETCIRERPCVRERPCIATGTRRG